jgi:hypothetical protein
MAPDSAANNHEQPREGRYANHFHIGFNAFEVVLQFGQFYEGNSQPVMHTTIITSPAYAQSLLQLLSGSLAQYRESFGELRSGSPHE